MSFVANLFVRAKVVYPEVELSENHTIDLDFATISENLFFEFYSHLGASIIPTLNVNLYKILHDNGYDLFGGFSIKLAMLLSGPGVGGNIVCRELNVNLVGQDNMHGNKPIIREHSSALEYKTSAGSNPAEYKYVLSIQ